MLGLPLFGQRYHVARAGNARRKGAVEIGDQRLEFIRAKGGVAARLVGEAVDGVMHAFLRRAPDPPRLLALESLDRPGQVIGRIPAIEFFAQRRGHHGADEEKTFRHPRPSPAACAYSKFLLGGKSRENTGCLTASLGSVVQNWLTCG